MSNETISKWLGECRHVNLTIEKGIYVCNDCKKQSSLQYRYQLEVTDYENDESAWTQELFGKIEEAGIEGLFAHALMDITGCPTLDEEESTGEGGYIDHVSFITMAYIISKATPQQKSLALSRAIEEVS